MRASQKIEREQIEIRQELAPLSEVAEPTEDQLGRMKELGKKWDANETRKGSALIAEAAEEKEYFPELENREETELRELEAGYDWGEAARNLDDGSPLSGRMAEWVQEQRNHGSFQGIPAPYSGLETRAGETIASGVADPKITRPTVERLFAPLMATKMGGSFVHLAQGQLEASVCTAGATGAWAATELGTVGAPVQYTTIQRPLLPNNNYGCQMKISRRALMQRGPQLSQSISRDMTSVIQVGADQAIFLGSGASGEPTGLIPGASGYGFNETTIDAAATFVNLRDEATAFLQANAAGDHSAVNLLVRHEIIDSLEDTLYTSTAVSHLDRLRAKLGKVLSTSSVLNAPSGSPLESSGLMTVTANGVPPFFVGVWGNIDLIRDNVTEAASGTLVLTALMTMDVTASRSAQVRVIHELQ